MRFYYRRGGKGAAPEGFDRVYTEVDGDGNVLRELLAYVRADDSVTVEMDGELGGTAGAFVEMALALYRQQATLLCKSPKIDTAAGHWQAVLSDLALLTSRDTGDAARLSRFMEGLHRCFDLVERRQMTVAEVCRKMSIGKTTYYRYQGFSICGPVQALRLLAPQPVGPSACRRNQAISAGLCHVPGFALSPCVRRAPFRLFFIFRSGRCRGSA